jgi:hypothetical protein
MNFAQVIYITDYRDVAAERRGQIEPAARWRQQRLFFINRLTGLLRHRMSGFHHYGTVVADRAFVARKKEKRLAMNSEVGMRNAEK